jgi:SAM-dependent methyltransferase
VLDVGCGPGALTAELVRRVGPEHVSAVEPAAHFAQTCRERVPDADIRTCPAEQLPWSDAEFDLALAQLVVSFMADADHGAAEMRRVVRKGGTVALCMWGAGPALEMGHVFWQSASEHDRSLDGRDPMRYRSDAELRGLLERAGLAEIESSLLALRVRYSDLDDFWDSIVHGAGTIGSYMATVDAQRQSLIRESCRQRLGNPSGPFELNAQACAVRGRA